MPEHKGLNSNAKKITYNLPAYEGNYTLTALSKRERLALLSSIIPVSWLKRHDSLPDDLDTQDKLDAWTDKLRLKLMQDIEICAEIIKCIETDEDTKAALTAWLMNELATNEDLQQQITNITYYNNVTGLPSLPGTSTNVVRADCDKDTAAGYVSEGIVDRAFDNIEQMFDVMILATTDEQKKAAFFDFIPVLGEIADLISYDSIITFVGNVTVWIKAQFEAEDSPSLRTRYYRDLLCLYMNNCKLSIEDIRDYFWKEASQANNGFNDALGTAVDLYNFLMNGTASSFSGIVPVLMGVQFGGAYYISNLFGMPLEEFKLLASVGEPTNDWIAWESEHGVCECYDIYKKPDNPIPSFVPYTGTGLIGIQNVLAASQVFFYSGLGGGNASSIGGTIDIDVTDCVKVTFVTDLSDYMSAGITIDGITYSGDFLQTYYIAPGKFGYDVVIPNITGNIEQFLWRTAPIPNTQPFLWLEFWVWYPC